MAVALSHPSTSASVADYWALLKPRVMSLVVFTGFCGLLLAPGILHPILAFTAVLAIAIGAGAAGALNMWLEQDRDAQMTRTCTRPLPQGRVAPESAFTFAIMLAVGSVMIMDFATNHMAAFLLAFTIFFYTVIYTLWLKPLTSQNIVIGGLAGALPPVIGWTAVTGMPSLNAWLLCLIIFLWTPPHFWALALDRSEEYRRAGIPMLPVIKGPKKTKQQIVIYTFLLAGSTILPVLTGLASVCYGVFAALLSLALIIASLQLYHDAHPLRFFGYSIVYLFLIFLGLIIDHLVFHA